MKKPITIFFNDVHIKTGNEQAIVVSIKHLISYALKNSISEVIFAGDMFDTRAFQRLSELKTLEKILDLFHEAKIHLCSIPGNHEKVLYESRDSYLDIFKHYPNFTLFRKTAYKKIGGVEFTFIPFFSDDVLPTALKEARGTDILISHFEMNGSTHLGRVISGSRINKRLLKKWKKTYLGHFHNNHHISDDIAHLPSLRQANFGEDNNKGFSVIYDDLSYEIIKGDFKEYIKRSIDINTISQKEIKSLIAEHKNSSNVIRFEFTGDEEKLKALDKKQFLGTGIDIKIKYEKRFEVENVEKPEVIEKFDKAQIYTTFEEFCEKKGHNHKEGLVYLNEFLNK